MIIWARRVIILENGKYFVALAFVTPHQQQQRPQQQNHQQQHMPASKYSSVEDIETNVAHLLSPTIMKILRQENIKTRI